MMGVCVCVCDTCYAYMSHAFLSPIYSTHSTQSIIIIKYYLRDRFNSEDNIKICVERFLHLYYYRGCEVCLPRLYIRIN